MYHFLRNVILLGEKFLQTSFVIHFQLNCRSFPVWTSFDSIIPKRHSFASSLLTCSMAANSTFHFVLNICVPLCFAAIFSSKSQKYLNLGLRQLQSIFQHGKLTGLFPKLNNSSHSVSNKLSECFNTYILAFYFQCDIETLPFIRIHC